MDQAEWGVIYLSFGSLIDPKSLELLGKSLINELKVLPQRIIMKWNKELLPHVPSNVLVREWLPQSDILRKNENTRILLMLVWWISSLFYENLVIVNKKCFTDYKKFKKINSYVNK